uniref:Centromere/kinetochore protein zw10 homolog n=1 Tax=Neogobius melanostomus TaxID=47308 RepID=A0A8C6S748_9GOBI
MASFVTEVLASSGKLEKEDLSGKICKLSRKVQDTKVEVCDFMKGKYKDFLPNLQDSEELMEQVGELSRELDTLKNCIDTEVKQSVHTSVTEYADLKQQLEKNTVLITLLGHLKEFHTAMDKFTDALTAMKYVEAAEQLKKARDSMAFLKRWKDAQLPLLAVLNSELNIQRENLLYHLGLEWNRLVVWTLPTPPKVKGISQTRSDVALLKYILRPLVVYPCLSVYVTRQEGDGLVLALQRDEHQSSDTPSPALVYGRLQPVLKTLHSHLLHVSVGNQKLSSVLGDLIWEELSNCIIHDCLQHSIPSNSSQLDQYCTVIKETEDKKCRDVIVAARKLMTSKMHNTVKICPETKLLLPKLPGPGGDVKKQSAVKAEPGMVNAKQLSSSSMALPACRISESVQQLMGLALDTLTEARTAPPSGNARALQLFFTVRNIFQLYYDVVPTYHRENLLKFPHLAAIQHNNCMYLAHHLLTLGHHFSARLPQMRSEGVGTFVDMVPSFRKLGVQCFLDQLNVQRTELLDRLSTAHNLCNLDDEVNYTAASKAVRQLKRLSTVWQDVLPVSIYCKAMGTLLNTAIAEITAKIMALEDISSEEGEHLHTLCQTLLQDAPRVFTPLTEEKKNLKYQEEVALYVKKWGMFKELAVVLKANLQEIVDRWADGKGPLAVEFSGSEVKSLVRALFQNTERRAVALTKIK